MSTTGELLYQRAQHDDAAFLSILSIVFAIFFPPDGSDLDVAFFVCIAVPVLFCIATLIFHTGMRQQMEDLSAALELKAREAAARAEEEVREHHKHGDHHHDHHHVRVPERVPGAQGPGPTPRMQYPSRPPANQFYHQPGGDKRHRAFSVL